MNGRGTHRRPLRVLIEHTDAERRDALVQHFIDRGFEERACGGPHTLPDDTCPLVTEGQCSLVAESDIVFFDLDLDHDDEADVYRAIRRTHPDLPVVLEMPLAVAQRHRAELDGATVVPPFDTDHLVRVVEDAAHQMV